MIKKTEKRFLNIQSDIIDNFSSLEDKEHADISYDEWTRDEGCLLYTSPSPRDRG